MIKFPKMSIAASVVNRILNVHDEIESAVRMSPSMDKRGVPNVPEENNGAAIDEQLSAPAEPVDAAPDVAEAIALKGLV